MKKMIPAEIIHSTITNNTIHLSKKHIEFIAENNPTKDIVITLNDNLNILIYPYWRWDEILNARHSGKKMRLVRCLYINSNRTRVPKSNVIDLPDDLAEKAGLSKNIVLVTLSKAIEIIGYETVLY